MCCWTRRHPVEPELIADRAVCSHFLARGSVPTVTEDKQRGINLIIKRQLGGLLSVKTKVARANVSPFKRLHFSKSSREWNIS